jgi:hypothetical protein
LTYHANTLGDDQEHPVLYLAKASHTPAWRVRPLWQAEAPTSLLRLEARVMTERAAEAARFLRDPRVCDAVSRIRAQFLTVADEARRRRWYVGSMVVTGDPIVFVVVGRILEAALADAAQKEEPDD